jgi:hypothetical protein
LKNICKVFQVLTAAAADGITDCSFYYLCMWEYAGFGGSRITLTRCGG